MLSVTALLSEAMDSLSDAERKAAAYIIEEPRTAVFCTISELARKAETSSASIVRLCKKVGVSGYRDLQRLLSKDIYSARDDDEEPAPVFDLDSEARPEDLLKKAALDAKRSIDRLLAIMDPESIATAVTMIREARSVAVFGIGASGLAAFDLQQKLLRLGIPCLFAFDIHLQITTACGLGPGDVALTISNSSKTEGVLRAAHEAKESGARVIALTRVGSNPLSRLADLTLPIPADEAVFRRGAAASRITQLVVIDAIYSALIARDIEGVIPRIERSMRATHPNQAIFPLDSDYQDQKRASREQELPDDED